MLYIFWFGINYHDNLNQIFLEKGYQGAAKVAGLDGQIT